MADNKSSRDKQVQDADRRQRERTIQEELERMDDPEPPVDTSELASFETTVETLQFPATGADVVAAVGDETIATQDGTYTVAELVPGRTRRPTSPPQHPEQRYSDPQWRPR